MVAIRTATQQDYEAIKALCLLEGWSSYQRHDINIALDHSVVIVAQDAKKIIGFIRALSDGQITIFLCEILVAQEYRRQGVASLLVEYLHKMFPTARIDLISIADEFYENVGFRKIGDGYRKNIFIERS